MKIKLLLLFLVWCCSSAFLFAQTQENFENATGTSFTSGTKSFNITSARAGSFSIQEFTGLGWNGTLKDNKSIDNSGKVEPLEGVNLKIATADASFFRVGSFWLFLGDHNADNTVTPSNVTITGTINGTTAFTAVMTTGFNQSNTAYDATLIPPGYKTLVTNGFTKIDLSNIGGVDYSKYNVDAITITTGDTYSYLSLDAFNWLDPILSEVASIKRVDANPTNASSVNYTVKFLQSTTGLTKESFTLVTDPVVPAYSAITALTGSGDTYNLTVQTPTAFTGTLKVDLLKANSNLMPALGKDFTTAELYTIDKQAPTIASVTLPSNATYITGQQLVFKLNYNEVVKVTGTPQLGITIGTKNVNAVYTGGDNSTALSFAYTVLAGDLADAGISFTTQTLQPAGSIKDLAGNVGVDTFTPAATTGILVDAVVPTINTITRVSAATTNLSTLSYTVTFSEPVTGVDVGDFVLTKDGTADASINSIVSVSTSVYTVTINNAVGVGSLRLDLKASGTGIKDLAGNDIAAGFTNGQAYNHVILSLADATYANGKVNTPFSTTFTASNGRAPYSYTLSNSNLPAPFTLTAGGVLSGTPVVGGSYTFTVTVTDADQLTVSKIYTLTIDKLEQTISLAATFNSVYGVADRDPAATTNSNLNITYTSSNPNVATIVDGKVHILAVGNTNILANQAGNDVYSAAPQQSQSLTVTPATLTYTATAKTIVYGNTATGLTGTVSGFVYNDTQANATTGTAIFTTTATSTSGIGNYAISGSGLAADNYTFGQASANSTALTIDPRPITVTANADQKKIYGDADPVFTYGVTAGNLVNGNTFTGVLARAEGNDVGEYMLAKGTLTAGENYALTFVGSNFKINPRPVTITANAGQSKIYRGLDPTFTYTLSTGNLIGTDGYTGALDRETGENVGSYAIGIGSLSLGSNYAVTYVGANFSILQKHVTVTANAGQQKVYGSDDPTFTYVADPLFNGDTYTGALGRTPGENVGNSYAFNKGTLTAGGNYEIDFVSADFAIVKRNITVTANAGQQKTYNDADPVFAYTLSEELAAGNSISGALSRTAGANVGTYAYELGTLTAGGNYTLNLASGNFTIVAKQLLVTVDPGQQKTYGDADPVFTYGNPVLVAGNSFSGALTREAGENIGQYAIGKGSLSAGSNYNLTVRGANFEIKKRAITLTANSGQTKVYGTQDPVFAYTRTTGTLVGDDAITGLATRAGGENVGTTYLIGKGTLTAGDNYDLTFVGANFSITKRIIVVTANAGQKKTYGDLDPVFTYSFTTGSMANGESLTGILSRTAGENVGANYVIGKGSLSASSNYDFSFVGDLFSIVPRAVTLTVDANQFKIYGGADPVLTYTLSEALKSGNTMSGALLRAAGENVGDYAIAKGNISAGPNYTLTVIGNNFSIKPKTVLVTVTPGQQKTYGNADPVFAYTNTPLANGNSFTGALSRVAGNDVGKYAIGKGTLSAGSNYTLNVVEADFEIKQRPLTIAANAGQSKAYGDVDPIFAYTITSGSLVFNDRLQGQLNRDAGESVGSNYAFSLGSLSAGSNYSISFVPNLFAIVAKQITVVANAGQHKVYGSKDPVLTYSVTGGVLKAGDAFTGALARTAGEDVGTGYVINRGTLSINNNYVVNYTPANFSIDPAQLTITANDKEKFQGQANPSFTASYIGFVNQEDQQVLTKLPVFSTTATTNSLSGSYAIVVSGAEAKNYQIKHVNGNLLVKAAAPDNITLATAALYENMPVGSLAGTLSSSSLDPNAQFSYQLVSGTGDTDNQLFTIVGNEIKAAAVFNYEVKSSYSVRIATTSQYGLSFSKSFTIAIIDVNEVPTINAIANQGICAGNTQTVALSGITAGPEASQTTTLAVSSNNAALFESLNISKTGANAGSLVYKVKAGAIGTALVTVVVKDNGGTANGGVDTYETTFTLTVNALPVVTLSSDKGTEVSKGETIKLTATGGTTYTWADGKGIISGETAAQLSIRPTENTTYTVTATNANGCSTSASISIVLKEDYVKIAATNILSPNGDGKNDKWVIENIDLYPNNQVFIFDRAGRVIFSKKRYDNSWDGTLRGSPLTEGTYYYVIDFGDGKPKTKGFITILSER